MDRALFALGCLFAFFAVALGAFAAHVLKARLDADLFAVFEVGVRYHLVHALALLAAAWAAARWPETDFAACGVCFGLGILLFSGSLYALALSGLRWLGAVTPLGGLLFLAGWLLLGWKAWRSVP